MEKLSCKFTEILLKRHIIDAEKQYIYKIGFELIFADIINIIIILFIGVIVNTFAYSLIYLALFWTVRRFSGGYHAKTYTVCRTATVGIYILIVILSKIINTGCPWAVIICNVATIITMMLLAPVKHPNKQLTQKEVKANKLFALITSLFFVILSLILINIDRKEGLVISLTLAAIDVLMYIGCCTNRKEGIQNGKYNR